MSTEKKNKGSEKVWIRIARGALAACALSVLLVTVFAFFLLKQWIGADSLNIVNTGIKAVCAVIAALIATRGADRGVLLLGAASGFAYMAVTFLVFSLLSGTFSPSAGTLTDILMCVLGGIVVGVIRNLKR